MATAEKGRGSGGSARGRRTWLQALQPASMAMRVEGEKSRSQARCRNLLVRSLSLPSTVRMVVMTGVLLFGGCRALRSTCTEQLEGSPLTTTVCAQPRLT